MSTNRSQRCGRKGTAMLDVFVSLTLLLATISIATPLLVRNSQLQKSQRNYRIALDEVSNQLEALTGLPQRNVEIALQTILPSKAVAERLAAPELSGNIQKSDFGNRLVLTLKWRESNSTTTQVSLMSWLLNPTNDSASGKVESEKK